MTTRKKKVLDKKLQYKLAFKSAIWPLVIMFIIFIMLFSFESINNKKIQHIVQNQSDMIELFLTTPALQNSKSQTIVNAQETFKDNIGQLRSISQNNKIILCFLVITAILQIIIIIFVSILNSHRISGPIYVMRNNLQRIRDGEKNVNFRSLRKKDELKELYQEIGETIKYLEKKK